MRAEKQYLLEEIQGQVDQVNAWIVTAYDRMEPNVSWAFRRELSRIGASFEVVKKRVFLKILQEKGLEVSLPELQGNIGVILVEKDTLEASKALKQFSQDHEERLKPLFAWWEGVFYSSEQVRQLAELPSKDEMRAQFLGLLQAPMSQSLSVMQGLLTSVLYCLDNKAKIS